MNDESEERITVEPGGASPMSTAQFVPLRFNWKTGLLAPGLLLITSSSVFAHNIEKHFKVEPRSVVTIHNPSGKVVVKAWTKSEVMVIATHTSDKVEVDAEQTGNRVDVMTHQISNSISPEDLRADYQINVPEDAELQIHDDSGEVSVANVLGDMNVETVGAGVDLEDAAGYLTVRTVGGSFQCIRCAGRLEVSSISGSFKLLSLRSYHVHAQTSKGNINSQASLTPPAHAHPVYSKFGNAILGTFNAGHAKVELSSFDGTINILKRE